jgi:fructokinase
MIISCGDALIDFLPRKSANGADLFEPFAGGSMFNVAIALGRLGASAGFLGGLSTDFFGAMLRTALRESGVDFRYSRIDSRPTTLAFVSLSADGQARYAFFDEGSAGRTLTEADLPPLPVEVRALHFGSLALAEEPCGSAYETLMRNESPLRVISLDPNIRPTLIRNRDGYLARIARLTEMADIVKLSEDDLAWMAPNVAFDTVAAVWLRAGAKLVILTRGESGARAVSRAHSVAVPAVPVTVADTIGAGDTFSAAVLTRLDTLGKLDKAALADLAETELADVLSFAAKAAAITASRPGADPPRLGEVGV